MQSIRIKIKAFDGKVIDRAAKEIIDTAIRTGAVTVGPIPLPTDRKVWAVQRAPFAYGKHMDHFEMKTHKRLIEIKNPNPKTIEALTHLQLAAGVAIEIK